MLDASLDYLAATDRPSVGTDWRHYHGDGTITGHIELFDPGHAPRVAWRLPRTPATR